MDDIPKIEVHGVSFEVTAKGFDERMGSLARGLMEIDRIMTSLGPQKVRALHKAGLEAENDVESFGTTTELMAIERAGMKAAGAPEGCVIWLKPVNK
jgi:hypothetical protein